MDGSGNLCSYEDCLVISSSRNEIAHTAQRVDDLSIFIIYSCRLYCWVLRKKLNEECEKERVNNVMSLISGYGR
jgi:hypothetical protein